MEYNGYRCAIGDCLPLAAPDVVEAMNDLSVLFRSLIIYAVCVVLAVWLGFLLAGPLTASSLVLYGTLAFILFVPVLLRWHFPLLLLCWNFAAVAIFVPGRPTVGLTMIFLSLGISVLQRMMSSEHHFIRVPQITIPALCLIAVVGFTAKMAGFGLHIIQSESYGGGKYVYLVGGILGYFALSARRIPPERRNLYLGLYFLGGATAVIGDLINFLPHSFYYIYWFFNYYNSQQQLSGVEEHITRLNGTMYASLAIVSFMLARYGLRGIFLSRKPWRWIVLVLVMALGLVGGYRSAALIFALVLVIQFFLEGLHRTKLLPVFLSAGFVVALALIPLASHLPMGVQRSLSFLPYKVSTEAKLDAQASLDWRLNMWTALLPQIPQYLLLGKGYNINPLDYEVVMGPDAAIHSAFAQNDPLALAESYHNGPISVLIPFGIWGAIGFLWFVIAALRVLYLNYRNGDPDLRTINTLLLAAFAAHVIMFFFIGGDLSTEMMSFCGVLGLGVSFNGGVRRPVRVIQPARQWDRRRRLPSTPAAPAPAFGRQQPGPSR